MTEETAAVEGEVVDAPPAEDSTGLDEALAAEFAELAEDFTDDDAAVGEGGGREETEEEAPPGEDEPLPEAAEAPAPVETPEPEGEPVVPEVPQETPPAEETPQPEAEEQPAALTQEQINAQQVELNEKLAVRYSVPAELQEQFAENPEEVLPQLLSRVFLDAVQATQNMIAAQVPQILEQRQDAEVQRSEGEKQFLGQWPGLKDHIADVEAVGAIYRQAYPNATAEQFIKDVGLQVSVKNGIPLEGKKEEPETPAAPTRVPAPIGTVPNVAPAQPDNIFTQIAEEMLEYNRS